MIPSLALILWIAAGCLGVAYVLEMQTQIDKTWGKIETARHRLDALDESATVNEFNAITAKHVAESAQNAIDAHLAEVLAQRRANEHAARAASRPRKRHDRD